MQTLRNHARRAYGSLATGCSAANALHWVGLSTEHIPVVEIVKQTNKFQFIATKHISVVKNIQRTERFQVLALHKLKTRTVPIYSLT
jgi:hypothetical protein